MRWLLLLLSGCFVPDPVVDRYVDWDDDGEQTTAFGGTDCNDDDPDIHSRAIEDCTDGIDNNCDGAIDDADNTVRWYADQDRDGFGDRDAPSTACTRPPGFVEDHTDCNDDDPDIHPSAEELCGDGIDNDCNTSVDDGAEVPWFEDDDGDGVGTSAIGGLSCVALPGHAMVDGDCDDDEPDVHPGAEDHFYDGIDHNCDEADEYDRDGDGHRISPDDPAVRGAHPGVSHEGPDCDDADATVHPTAVELWYDGVDSNCRGDDDFDQDGDGHASDAYGGDDCDDGDPHRHPGAHDPPYDGLDADCNPANDDDVDEDGVAGGPGGTDCDDDDPNNHTACDTCIDRDDDGAFAQCDAYVTIAEDCDDADDTVHPGALDLLGDGVDQDCSGGDLDLRHPDLVFVTPTGIDNAACGNTNHPCRTIQYAADLAAISDKFVVVAAGDYDGFTTSVFVYGGVAADLSTSSTAPTRIVTTPVGARAAVQVDAGGVADMQIILTGQGDSAVGMALQGPAVVQNIDIDIGGTATRCTGLDVSTDATVDDVHILGCAGTGDVTGLNSTSGTGTLRVRDSAVTIRGGAFVVGIRGSLEHTILHNASVDAEGSTVLGLSVDHDVAVERTHVRAAGTDLSIGVYGVDIDRLTLHSSSVLAPCAGCGNGVSTTAKPNGTMHLHDSILVADGIGIAVRDGPGVAMTLTHSIVTHGTTGTLVRGGADTHMLAVNSVLHGHTLIEGSARYALHGVATDVTCAVNQGGCSTPVSAVGDLCGAACDGSSALQYGTIPFESDDPTLGVAASSPAVDGGVNPTPWFPSTTDVDGNPRPTGVSWDLGPHERR